MSNSHETGSLVVRAALGTVIEVLNGKFQIVETGHSHLQVELKKGLYTVRLSAADTSEKLIARVSAGGETVVESTNDILSPASVNERSSTDVSSLKWFKRLEDVLGEELAEGKAAIIVAVESSDGKASADVARTIELRSVSRKGEELLEGAGQGRDLTDGWSFRKFELEPGIYDLRFETYERKRVSQTIYGLMSRVSLVFLTYGGGRILAKSGNRSTLERRRGIDPSKTVLFSVESGAGWETLEASHRTARLLTFSLSKPAVRQDRDRMEGIASECRSDYYRRILLAANLLRLQEQERDSSKGENDEPDRFRSPELSQPPGGLVRGLLADSEVIGPDLKCLRWKSGIVSLERGDDPGAPLFVPPMLDICWRWASELSVTDPNIVENVAPIVRAGNASPAFRPWLVVGREQVSVPTEDVKTTLGQAASGLNRMLYSLTELRRQEGEYSAGSFLSFDDLLSKAGVSQQSIDLANTALKTSRTADGSTNLLAKLARNSGMPVTSLGPKLDQAATELDPDLIGGDLAKSFLDLGKSDK